MSLMKRDHSQVRYLSLLIIDELFMRSKLFRAILVENLDHLLTLSVGFRRNLPLPAPASVASVLRSKAIEFLEKWNTSFGIHYRQLRLGYDYLKNTLRFQFPNLQANALRIQHERRERELRTKDILLKKLQTLKDNLASIKDEIQSTTDEICECLNILNTKDEEDIPLVPLDDEDIEEFRNSELRQLRHDSLKEGEKVRENTDNKVVFDALRELYRVLMTKHIVAVQEWISVLIRVETEDTRFRDSTLKDFIDIRNHLKSVKAKCEASGCTLSKTTCFEEEVIWEDGNVGSFESRKPVGTQNNDDGRALASNPSEVRCEASATEGSDRCPKGNRTFKVKKDTGGESNPLRSELLDNAPVLDWSSFLDNWGSKRDALANQRGLDLDGHWGRVDPDAVIPAEKIAELNLHMTVYREDPVEIQPCRAPLRKDMTHADDNLVEQLARQAVKNVRERDKGEAKQREHERQNLKRAKLAKVREHNEAVLRDAAIASSSYSYAGEDQHTTNGTKYSARNKKETLASMLKKKETVKDRLAQKLLNSRARDATQRQLTAAEEANFREAFPNQW
nr:UV-stimulated scaffold protein A homolog [Ipomoea batatas]